MWTKLRSGIRKHLATHGVAVGRKVPDGFLKENIFFLHIAKCGGTSVSEAIGSCFFSTGRHHDEFHLNSQASKNGTTDIFEQPSFPFEAKRRGYLVSIFKEYMLLYHMGLGTKYINGHFRFSDTAYERYSEKYAFITYLRDPVDRFVSSYFHKRFKRRTIDIDFTDYLKQQDACRFEGAKYVKVLCGIHDIEDRACTSSFAIDKAKENLRKFRIVGCLEHRAKFLDQLEQEFGKRPDIQVLNPSLAPKAYRNSVVSEKAKEEIKELCRPDLEIYQHALDQFVNK